MASNTSITVLEHSYVAPPAPPSTAAEFSLPLTFFDILLVNYDQVPRLLFYDFPHPKEYFVEKIIPSLKTSLSLTLKHYLPIAGNLSYPLNDIGMPKVHYVTGDSVSITFAECSEDFNLLKQNHARDADKFYPLIPQMPATKTNASESKTVPLLALQVTLFPNSGMVVAITTHHVVTDANTAIHFLKIWASINKHDGDATVIEAGSLPFFDRATIKDPHGLDTIIWNKVKNEMLIRSKPLVLPTNKFRATFVLHSTEIEKLKNFVLNKRPNVAHTSTFVVTCAYVWICWIKARGIIGEVVKEDEPEHFVFSANCRSRLDPPLPPTYFGNCLVGLIATSLHGQLIENDGFLIAAESIKNVIHKKLSNKGEILEDFQNWLLEICTMNQLRKLGVSGSPKFDAYDVDYGWGKPKKFEQGNIDVGVMSLNKSGKSEGGVEVGLVLPKDRMDAFAKAFEDGFRAI